MISKEEAGKGIDFVAKYFRDQKFLDKENWSDIKRGWIYEAVVPYTAERPLDFFVPDDTDPLKGTITTSKGIFNPKTVQKAVFELKQRKVCIITNDDMCQDKTVYDITIAPIYGVYQDDKQQSWYNEALNDQHPFYTYLEKQITGMECIVDLSNTMTINKSMLLKDKYDMTHRMSQVEECLGYCFSLGLYKKKQAAEEDAG
ncbi:hypothetical protein [Paenibacillus sp. GM1FR]|uniref:hypothetical protein n=1 Tax=Paenibacillus sp. GM1FR TaxID=2059267 RepID=UPI0013FD225B|nr:hypothetical protein [Paenibacillus sp. GM1FR]